MTQGAGPDSSGDEATGNLQPAGEARPHGYGEAAGYGAPPPGSGPLPGYAAPPPGYGTPPPGYGGYGQYGGYGRPAAPKPGIVPLRPLSAGEILDGAFTAMRWNPKTILVSSAVVAAVSGVLLSAVSLVLQHGVLTHFNLPANGQTITSGQVLSLGGEFLALGGVSVVFYFLSSTILTGVLTVAVGQGVLGRKETLGSAWRATRSRIGALLAVVLLSALFIALGWAVAVGLSVLVGVLLGAVAHLVPLGILVGVLGSLTATVFAVIIAIRWRVAVPVVMLERRGPLASLRRSWQLVRRSSWRVLGITLLIQIVVSIAQAVIQAPFQLAGGGSFFAASVTHPSPTATITSAIGGIIASTLTTPLVAGTVVLLYADLRMRREGMDITLQAAAASQGADGTVGEQPGGAGPGGQNLGPW